MREEPIISRAWIKAALVLLVGGALGLGAYALASDVEINLPDLDLDTTAETTFPETTFEAPTVAEPEPTSTSTAPGPAPTTPAPPATPSIEQLQELNRCIQSARGDLDEISACFARFRR